MKDLTFLLRKAIRGDKAAENEAFELIYPELKRIAALVSSGENPDPLLSTTVLVNDFYVQKFRAPAGIATDITDRNHFFALAARAMGQVLIGRARERNAIKRQPIDPAFFDRPGTSLSAETLIALEQALRRLEKLDPRSARVVELKFYLGCPFREIAEILGISQDDAADDWAFAREWLRNNL